MDGMGWDEWYLGGFVAFDFSGKSLLVEGEKQLGRREVGRLRLLRWEVLVISALCNCWSGTGARMTETKLRL